MDNNLIVKNADTVKVKNEISAMAVVFCNNKILAISENIYGKESVSLPKGHKENGEHELQTAIRECFEETNLVITEQQLVKELAHFSYEFLSPNNLLIIKEIIPYLFNVENEGNPIAKEERISFVNWMDVEEFFKKCSYKNVKSVVESALKEL